MLRAEEAWARLEPWLGKLPAESVGRRQALWRVLAEGVAARLDVPAADVSAMDGYAVAGEPPLGQPLPVAATVVAGDPPGLTLVPGTAVRIMTGAPVPAGADRVIPVEDSDRGRESVLLSRPGTAGAHLRHRGEIVRAGESLLAAGSLLTPGGLSLLAAHGVAEVEVHRQPRVAVLVTGDEVVPPEVPTAPGQLKDSHTDFLLAAGRSLGLAFEPLGIAPDERERLRERVAAGLAADVLLLTGGVSMGELDLVEGVLAELGCEILFDGVALQPGKPLVAARHAGGLVFGLPGNPGSVMVDFWLFVRPALRRLAGLKDGFWQGTLTAKLAEPLPAAGDRDRILPAEVRFEAGRLLARLHPPRGSHDLSAFAFGTCLVRVRSGSPARGPGEPCEVLPLADWRV